MSALLVVTTAQTGLAEEPPPTVTENGGFVQGIASDAQRGLQTPPPPRQQTGGGGSGTTSIMITPSESQPVDTNAPDVAVLPIADVRTVAHEVIVALQLPSAAPRIGPDPSVNEWNMAVVGFPLWLWTDGPRTLSATRSAHGITFTLAATQRSTTFAMGDGNTVSCATTQPYPAQVTPGTPSPVCGYVYQKGKARKGTYTVTATTYWDVQWSALGYSGTLPARMTGTRELPVGELQAVVTR